SEPSPADLAFGRRVLGEDFDYDPDVPYDEHLAILDDILKAREAMRDKMRAMAKAMNIDVDEAAIAAWDPDEKELSALRHNADRSVRMYAKIAGIAEYMSAQADEARKQGTPLKPHQQA